MPFQNAPSAETARDRYPGKHHQHCEAGATPETAIHCFSVRADLEPGLLSRLIEPFAKRGLWPNKFYSQAVTTDQPDQITEAMIDIQIAGLDSSTADHIAMQIRGTVGVQSVLTSVRASND